MSKGKRSGTFTTKSFMIWVIIPQTVDGFDKPSEGYDNKQIAQNVCDRMNKKDDGKLYEVMPIPLHVRVDNAKPKPQ